MRVLWSEIFGDMKADINETTIIDRSFNIVDLPRINFDISQDLVTPALTGRSAVVKQILQDLLPFAAGAFPRLFRVIAASSRIKPGNISVRSRDYVRGRSTADIKAPNLECMIESGAGTVQELVIQPATMNPKASNHSQVRPDPLKPRRIRLPVLGRFTPISVPDRN